MEVVVTTVARERADALLEQLLDRVNLLLLHLRRQAHQLLERQPVQAVGLGVEECRRNQLRDLVVVRHARADRRQLGLLLIIARLDTGLASQLLQRPVEELREAGQVGRLVVAALRALRNLTDPGDALRILAGLRSRVVRRVLRIGRVAHERRDRSLPRTDPRAILRVRLELDADLAGLRLHDLVGRPHAEHVIDLVHVAHRHFGHRADVVDEALLEGARTAGTHAPVVRIEFRQLPHEHHRPELVRRHLLLTDHDDRLIEDERLVLHAGRDGLRDQLGVRLHEPDDDTLQQVPRLVHVDAVDERQTLDQVPRDEGEVPTARPKSSVVHGDDSRTAVERADEDREDHIADRDVDGGDDLLDVILRLDLVQLQRAGQREEQIGLDHRPDQRESVLERGVERLTEASRPHLDGGEDGRQLIADELQRTLVELPGRRGRVALLQLRHHLRQGIDDLFLSRGELGVQGVGDFRVLGSEQRLVLAEGLQVGSEERVDRLREQPVDHDVGEVMRDPALGRSLRHGRIRLDEVDDARHRERHRVQLAEDAHVDAVAALGDDDRSELEVHGVSLGESALHEFGGRGERIVLLATADEERRATEETLLRAVGVLMVGGDEFENGVVRVHD